MLNFYPTIFYKVNDFDSILVKDITVSIKLSEFINESKKEAFRPYIVKNGERPDQVSYRLYNVSKFDYIILLINNIHDIYNEWPMSYTIFNEYIESKYGSISASQTTDNGYYYNSNGIQISKNTWLELSDPNKFFKTFYEYENEINTKKSFINIIEYNKLIKFEVELRKIMSQYKQIEVQ